MAEHHISNSNCCKTFSIKDILSYWVMTTDVEVVALLEFCRQEVNVHGFAFRNNPPRVSEINKSRSDQDVYDDIICAVRKHKDSIMQIPKWYNQYQCDGKTSYYREQFVKIFYSVFGKRVDDILDMCEQCTFTSDFHLFKTNDTYYIVHLNSGIIIEWYKHIGRSAACNKHLTEEEIIFILELLYYDIIIEDKGE